jgi:hypothetical protein
MNMVPNQEGEFSGIYLAHCLDERIEVAIGKRFGVFTVREPWQPTFPSGFVAPGGENFPQLLLSTANCLPFYIRFIGTPGEPDVCGYKGSCRRRVAVHRVLELREVEGGIG